MRQDAKPTQVLGYAAARRRFGLHWPTAIVTAVIILMNVRTLVAAAIRPNPNVADVPEPELGWPWIFFFFTGKRSPTRIWPVVGVEHLAYDALCGTLIVIVAGHVACRMTQRLWTAKGETAKGDITNAIHFSESSVRTARIMIAGASKGLLSIMVLFYDTFHRSHGWHAPAVYRASKTTWDAFARANRCWPPCGRRDVSGDGSFNRATLHLFILGAGVQHGDGAPLRHLAGEVFSLSAYSEARPPAAGGTADAAAGQFPKVLRESLRTGSFSHTMPRIRGCGMACGPF